MSAAADGSGETAIPWRRDPERPGHGTIPEGWGQGRSTFGGLLAATALHHARASVTPDRVPRSVAVSFVAPMGPGPYTAATTLLREGGSVSHAEARLVRDDAPCVSALIGFGAPRTTPLGVGSRSRPDAPAPETLPVPVTDAPHIPEFVRRFDLRWAIGDPPYAGSACAETGGWLRYRAGGGIAPTAEWVLAMLDTWPAPIVSMMDRPGPASSLAWSAELLPVDRDASLDAWWFYRAHTVAADGGYTQTRAELWDPSGRLTAVGQQTVAYFPKSGAAPLP